MLVRYQDTVNEYANISTHCSLTMQDSKPILQAANQLEDRASASNNIDAACWLLVEVQDVPTRVPPYRSAVMTKGCTPRLQAPPTLYVMNRYNQRNNWPAVETSSCAACLLPRCTFVTSQCWLEHQQPVHHSSPATSRLIDLLVCSVQS